MTDRQFPSSPTICASCGADVNGSVTINGEGICKKCYKRFNLEERFGFTLEELFGEETGGKR